MVTITCERPFYDLKARVDRSPGDTWDDTKARADEIEARIPGFVTYKAKPARRRAPADKD